MGPSGSCDPVLSRRGAPHRPFSAASHGQTSQYHFSALHPPSARTSSVVALLSPVDSAAARAAVSDRTAAPSLPPSPRRGGPLSHHVRAAARGNNARLSGPAGRLFAQMPSGPSPAGGQGEGDTGEASLPALLPRFVGAPARHTAIVSARVGVRLGRGERRRCRYVASKPPVMVTLPMCR